MDSVRAGRPLALAIPAIAAGTTVKVALGQPTTTKYGYVTQLSIMMGTISANGSVLIAISDGRVDESGVTDAATVPESEWCLYEPTTSLLTTDSGLLAYATTKPLETAWFSDDYPKYLFIKSLSTFAMDNAGVAKVAAVVAVP